MTRAALERDQQALLARLQLVATEVQDTLDQIAQEPASKTVDTELQTQADAMLHAVHECALHMMVPGCRAWHTTWMQAQRCSQWKPALCHHTCLA